MKLLKKNAIGLFLAVLSFTSFIQAQEPLDVVGLCVALPEKDNIDRFVAFIDNELASAGINTLVLRVDYRYAYQSQPKLRNENPLDKADIKKIVVVAKKHQINIVPQVNLLGHQSWHSKHTKLLEVYPEFDETPQVKLPENYVWPNDDGLYCKSYCPLHPEVHNVVFDLVDEIVEVFETKAFHAGMDEVFYLADDQCPRCKGKSTAELFAGEVTKISNHLAKKDIRLWIWGDRLLEGVESGIGIWEGSDNQTETAIDMIPKSVVINDWHYEQALPTPSYFAYKGFDVIACPWRKPNVAEDQVAMMNDFRNNSPDKMKKRFKGVMHTVWSSAENFMDVFQGKAENTDEKGNQVETFKAMVTAANALSK